MRLHLGVCVLFVLLLATLTVALVLEATDALRLNKATAWFYCRIFVDTSAFKRQPIHYGVTATTRWDPPSVDFGLAPVAASLHWLIWLQGGRAFPTRHAQAAQRLHSTTRQGK